jgi:3-dehydroquinate dehydratase-2
VSRVLVLNGPNLGQLGRREPLVYGRATYADLCDFAVREGKDLGLEVEVRQTDSEAELVGWLHGAGETAAAVVLNPAALSHYSIAVRDAVSMTTVPVVEVHITNIAAREQFRHHSVVSAVASGTITGFGLDSYRLGLSAVARLLAETEGGVDA